MIEKTVQEARHLLSHSDITVKLEVTLAHNFADASSARRPASPPADDVISQASSRGSHSVPIENQRRPSQCEEGGRSEGRVEWEVHVLSVQFHIF